MVKLHGWRFKIKEGVSCWTLSLVGHRKYSMEKEEWKRSKKRVSDVRVQRCPRSSHVYGYTYVDVCSLLGRVSDLPQCFLVLSRGSLPVPS